MIKDKREAGKERGRPDLVLPALVYSGDGHVGSI